MSHHDANNRITHFFDKKINVCPCHETVEPVNRLAITEKTTSPPMPNSRFGTHVPDDSMEPEFFEGDLLMIDPQAVPENKDFVLAFFDGKFHVRQYFFDQDKIELRPCSSNYPTIQKHRNEFSICGVVVNKVQKRTS